MKVLNTLLIICGLLLFFIGLETEAPEPSTSPPLSPLGYQISQGLIDLRPNIEQVIDQLYPM